ncbi:cytochrome c biogenesis FN [Cucumis melo var. makuwa]|nr:cytochrome c biogenesis FN [Cucumis melo var. makuwa]
MQKDATEKNGTLLCTAGCIKSRITRGLVDTERQQVKPPVRNGKKETTTSFLYWITVANTVVFDQNQEPMRIWILISQSFLTVGILRGSWWAHHELGRGGWWFWDSVENASFMPRVLATTRIHSIILPL